MPTESWVLDGITLTSGDFNLLELTADPPRERPEWITAADSESGALVRQPLHENRVITMKLRVTPQASMDVALDEVGTIIDKLRRASKTPTGIPLVWTPADSTRTRTFDVLDGEITEMPIGIDGLGRSWLMARPVFTIEMTCKPYWRGTEVLTSTASSSTPITTFEVPSVPGDVPALGRLIVTDTATQNRRHIEWGIEGPTTYNSGTSLIFESDSFVTSGFGGVQTTLSGAYDPGGAGNSIVRLTLQGNPAVMFSTGNLSHIGSFRVRARVYTDDLEARLRLSYQDGDGPYASLPWVKISNTTAFFDVDLGTINITPKISGTQRWTGQLFAYGTSGGFLYVDYLLFIPVQDGYGKARGRWSEQPSVANVGYDEFTGTTSGAGLTGRVAPVGGTWATSGSTTDFAFTDEFSDQPSEAINRATTVDTGNGRFAVLGATNYTNTGAQAKIVWQGYPANVQTGVIIRYVDASNYLLARVASYSIDIAVFELMQRVAGVETRLMIKGPVPLVSRQAVYVRVVAYTTGRVTAVLFDVDGVTQLAVLDTIQTVAATGGALATGKPGLLDKNASSTAVSRYIDGFQVFTPAPEPIAVYSGRTLEFRHDDTLRQDSTGVYYGRPQTYNGARFLVPVGTSRVAVKARRNDVDVDADSQVTDATQIQVGYQPRGIAVPR